MNELMIKVTGVNTPQFGDPDVAYLDLFPDTSISFEINNPIFNTEVIEGAFSYPLNIPASPKNKKLLGLLSPLETRDALNIAIPCEIFDTGNLALIGTLRIQQVSAVNIQIFFLTAQSIIAKLATQSLRTLDFGGKKLVDEAYEYYAYQFSGTDGSIDLAINADHYIVDFTVSIEQTCFLLAAAASANSLTAEAVAYGDIVFLRYKNSYTESDYVTAATFTGTMDGAVLIWNVPHSTHDTNTVIQNHMTHAANNVVKGRYLTTFFPVYNPGFYSDDDPFYANEQNRFYFGVFPFQDLPSVPAHSPVTPFPYLKKVIYKIFETAGYLIEDNFFDDELATLCLYSVLSLDIKKRNADDVVVVVNDDAYDVAQALPDVTIGSFLNGLQKMFALAFIFDHARRRVNMIPFKSLLLKKAADWTKYCEPDPDVVFDGPTGMELNYEFDGDDSYISAAVPSRNGLDIGIDYQHFWDLPTAGNGDKDVHFLRQLNQYWKVVIGDGNPDQWEYYSDALYPEKVPLIDGKETHITSSISTLGTIGKLGDPSDNISPHTMPQTNQVGISTNQSALESHFTPRLLFYRGFRDSWMLDEDDNPAAGISFPFGSNANFLPFDDDPIGNYSLSWETPYYGLYAQWWQKWVAFLLKTKRVKCSIRMNMPLLKQLDLSSPVSVDRVQFFISKISLQLPLKKKSKIEFWKK